MIDRLSNQLYLADLEWIASQEIAWDHLANKDIAISGATGLIGTVLVDVLLNKNDRDNLGCHITALGRDAKRAKKRLPYTDRDDYSFEEMDISVPGSKIPTSPDFVFHLASTTHPKAYATQPIATIGTNVVGAMNLLASLKADGHFVLASSVEIYGENRGDTDLFDERYLGYIDCNTLRAGYPEAKRVCEALCQAYASESGIHVSIPRLPRTYGPTLLRSDTKALSQFLWNGLQGEDIVLKSKGDQFFSYLYVADVVSGILWVTLQGDSGRAYNIADDASNATLSELANLIAAQSGTSVVYDLPSETERKGYSTATRAAMDSSRLKALGWNPKYSLREGIQRTLELL